MLNSRRIWAVIHKLPKVYQVEQWTAYEIEFSWYHQGIMEQFEVEFYYSPWDIQKRIDELESKGNEVIINV